MFMKINYGDIWQFIRDTCLFTSKDMGYLISTNTSHIAVPYYIY